MKIYRLTSADGSTFESTAPATLGGYRPKKIYGHLDCPSADRHLANGHYRKHRVFFADEAAAIAAGYRPCAKCMPERYAAWKSGGRLNAEDYPWQLTPGISGVTA